MNQAINNWLRVNSFRCVAACLFSLTCIATGCGSGMTQTPGTNGGNNGGTDSTTDNALGFKGTLSGKLEDDASTRDASADLTSAQNVPLEFDTQNTCVRFRDLAGEELMSADGTPMGETPVEDDGSFTAENLPVGVDFVVCGDIGKDGECDIESCVNIPSDNGGEAGTLDDVRADPLTTLVLAKLRRLLDEQNIDVRDLPVSPAAIVARVVDAYSNLFEESGIDQRVSLDDIENISRERLDQLFDEIIPSVAQTGVKIVEGNLDLARANGVEDQAIGAAKVFLRAGFPIADPEGGLDLSVLANLDGVEVTTISALRQDPFGEPGGPEGPGPNEGMMPTDSDSFDEFFDGGEITPAQLGDIVPSDHTVYINTSAEPDRNFASSDDEDEAGAANLPLIGERVLLVMARLKQENRTITLQQLYEVLTNIDNGLGVRLTYQFNDPNFRGPPLTVFETEDGRGRAINMERLFSTIFNQGLLDLDPEQIEEQQTRIQDVLRELISGTTPPAFDRLFGGVTRNRVADPSELANALRRVRAHLPFSRSGPSTFFVVADGDPFEMNTEARQLSPEINGVSAITVDAEISNDGRIVSVSYNESGSGEFYLGFTRDTDKDGLVELISIEAGRPVHGKRGPARVSIFDTSVFQTVGGQPFAEIISRSGSFYPGTNFVTRRTDFTPDSSFDMPGGGTTTGSPAPTPGGDGPNQQLFVLTSGLGRNASPVFVDYDPGTGSVTYNPEGSNVLTFLPDSNETGEFGLFNKETGKEVRTGDPNAFFQAPPEKPEGFEDFFNEFGGRDDVGMFDNPEDLVGFIEDTIDRLPPPPGGQFPPGEFPDGGMFAPNDGTRPEDGLFPPGEMPPPGDEDFNRPPGDNMMPPPGDGVMMPPNDGNVPPPPPGEDMMTPSDPDGTMMSSDTMTTSQPQLSGDTTQGSGMTAVDPMEIPNENPEEMPTGDMMPPADGNMPPPPGGNFPPPPGDGFTFDFGEPVFVNINDIAGVIIERQNFSQVFGVEVANARYNPDGDPYYDDINGNDMQDDNEPSSPFRPALFDISDWRSTDIPRYYRRADNNESVNFENIDFMSETPMTLDGIALVAREWRPRLNAFRFGRPNTAFNLLTAFAPPEFFNGTRALTADTEVDVYTAVAIVNLIMDQVLNVEAEFDIDGVGPRPAVRSLLDAQLFVVPLDDPFVLLIRGIEARSQRRDPVDENSGSTGETNQ